VNKWSRIFWNRGGPKYHQPPLYSLSYVLQKDGFWKNWSTISSKTNKLKLLHNLKKLWLKEKPMCRKRTSPPGTKQNVFGRKAPEAEQFCNGACRANRKGGTAWIMLTVLTFVDWLTVLPLWLTLVHNVDCVVTALTALNYWVNHGLSWLTLIVLNFIVSLTRLTVSIFWTTLTMLTALTVWLSWLRGVSLQLLMPTNKLPTLISSRDHRVERGIFLNFASSRTLNVPAVCFLASRESSRLPNLRSCGSQIKIQRFHVCDQMTNILVNLLTRLAALLSLPPRKQGECHYSMF